LINDPLFFFDWYYIADNPLMLPFLGLVSSILGNNL
jgi:hypothetical protein